jgi:hypothetical protein
VPQQTVRQPDGSVAVLLKRDCAEAAEYTTEEFRRSHNVFKVK